MGFSPSFSPGVGHPQTLYLARTHPANQCVMESRKRKSLPYAVGNPRRGKRDGSYACWHSILDFTGSDERGLYCQSEIEPL
jgi:hypothetical protein